MSGVVVFAVKPCAFGWNVAGAEDADDEFNDGVEEADAGASAPAAELMGPETATAACDWPRRTLMVVGNPSIDAAYWIASAPLEACAAVAPTDFSTGVRRSVMWLAASGAVKASMIGWVAFVPSGVWSPASVMATDCPLS